MSSRTWFAVVLALFFGVAGAVQARGEVLPSHEDDGSFEGRIGVDSDSAAITRLDPDLRTALQDAARAAARDGVTVEVNSGWRSAAYQQRLPYFCTASSSSRCWTRRCRSTAAGGRRGSGSRPRPARRT